ncbi:MAG: hypothetical protein HYZ34_01610 [Ignavibacteriae bacterium]|nr:hypothetical protein [Ignavibacteriota bacterium]
MAVNKKFLDRIKEVNKVIKEKSDFFILVWGSGPNGKENYEERIKIRSALAEHFGDNNVFFSEDESFRTIVSEQGAVSAEYRELEAADFVVVLATSIGPLLEVAIFYNKLKSKGYILVPEKYKDESSFAFHSLRLVEPYWFSEAELSNGELQKVCIQKAYTYQTAKLIYM